MQTGRTTSRRGLTLSSQLSAQLSYHQSECRLPIICCNVFLSGPVTPVARDVFASSSSKLFRTSRLSYTLYIDIL